MSDPNAPGAAATRVRVGIVDDSSAVRMVLRALFEADGRFDVVGEAADGRQAIQLVAELEPDLLVLDRQMPNLGGLEAVPEIRRVAPGTAVVIFTAGSDAGTHQAALAAGALDVLEKTDFGPSLIDTLGRILLDHLVDAEAAMEICVGPVPSVSARVWVENTMQIVRALRTRRNVLPEGVPDDVLDLFGRFLQRWWDLAVDTDDFYWTARAEPDEVERLVEQWAMIDRMTDDQLRALGCTWAPPRGEPFRRALEKGVLAALDAHSSTQRLAAVLRAEWPDA